MRHKLAFLLTMLVVVLLASLSPLGRPAPTTMTTTTRRAPTR